MPLSFLDIKQKLTTQLLNSANTVNADIDKVFPNQGYNPTSADWVKFDINLGETFMSAMGANQRYRTPGIITVKYFTSLGTGTGTAIDFLDEITQQFTTITIDGVVWKTPYQYTMGRDSSFWVEVLTLPFHHDDYRL